MVSNIVGLWDDPESAEKPLGDDIVRLIHANERQLTDLLDLNSGLISQLLSVEFLSQRQKASLKSEIDMFHMNDKFLHMLTRTSVAKFQLFLRCLQDPNIRQSHIVNEIFLQRAGMFE